MGDADVVADSLDAFVAQVGALAAAVREQVRSAASPMASRTLAYAVAAGFPPRVAYSVREMAEITGIDLQTIYAENRAGRLRCIKPANCERGLRVPVDEMDRWLDANTR